ncbi:hypothetical protein D3C75_234270 [compost metagenome]
MLYTILNAGGFFIFFMVACFSAVLLVKTNRQNIIRVILLSGLTVFPGYLAWNCLKGMVNGDLYESETTAILKKQLSGKKSESIDIMAFHSGYNAYGYKFESLSVDNIWHGNIKFNDENIPYNLYEVNTVWRNRAEGKTEKRCFLYSWANDTENDYRRYIRVFDECEKKSFAISELKKRISIK